jgi:HD-like signal output (HDOD) protein
LKQKSRTKILFVDDEPDILRELQRSLKSLKDYWDMSFVEDGENALEVLEKEVFDVILSDLRMPGIDGLRLLELVKFKYPRMVRIILSEHSDKMILKTVTSAQQYLPKPCEKELLISTITRACSLRDILHSQVLKSLLGRIETMPSIPAVYANIMEALGSEDTSAASVGEIIAQDMGMAVKVLQLVNSSFFGMSRHISSVKEATVLLGIDVVKTLVLGIEVFSRFDGAQSVISVNQIHDHCVRTAMIAKQIAVMENMDSKKADHAMICATVHDIGRLLLADHFPEKYKQVVDLARQKEMHLFQAENAVYGVTHSEVGAYLLGLWGLPQSIVEGVAFHHRPGSVVSKEFELSGLIHVAELMEHHERKGLDHDLEAFGLDMAYLEKLRLADKILFWQDSVARAE